MHRHSPRFPYPSVVLSPSTRLAEISHLLQPTSSRSRRHWHSSWRDAARSSGSDGSTQPQSCQRWAPAERNLVRPSAGGHALAATSSTLPTVPVSKAARATRPFQWVVVQRHSRDSPVVHASRLTSSPAVGRSAGSPNTIPLVRGNGSSNHPSIHQDHSVVGRRSRCHFHRRRAIRGPFACSQKRSTMEPVSRRSNSALRRWTRACGGSERRLAVRLRSKCACPSKFQDSRLSPRRSLRRRSRRHD